jgi:hypothetical protein
MLSRVGRESVWQAHQRSLRRHGANRNQQNTVRGDPIAAQMQAEMTQDAHARPMARHFDQSDSGPDLTSDFYGKLERSERFLTNEHSLLGGGEMKLGNESLVAR